MKFRTLGKEQVSALGFGLMRLPVIDNDQGKIDEPETERMIRYAIDHGVNYLDTAWGYHKGESEPVVGRILAKGLRDKIYLATKYPQWLAKTFDDFDNYLNQQLARLQTDHFDFYLVHALGKASWEKMSGLGIGRFLDKALSDGRIRHAGFSFHDDGENFAGIVDGYNWSFCQIQYNYMDIEEQAGTKGLKYAVSRGLDVIVMEPLRGGKLTKKVPMDVLAEIKASGIDRTPVEFALRWVWNHPEVSLVLSGMSAMEQMIENCRIADGAFPGCMTESELELIGRISETYAKRAEIPCTSCRYCLPCPQGVDIPEIFRIYNDLRIYEDPASARFFYSMFMKPETRADKCEECAKCEELCPQGIDIRELLKTAHQELADK